MKVECYGKVLEHVKDFLLTYLSTQAILFCYHLNT